jgi:hypothetical protein
MNDVENVKRTFFRERDKLKNDAKIDKMNENETKKMKRNDNTNEEKKSRI